MDIYELIKNLYGVTELKGCTEEEISFLKEKFGAVPPVLEEFYRRAVKTEMIHRCQDTWILPEQYQKSTWLNDCGYFVIVNENQGVFRKCILLEDMKLSDPPVYIDFGRGKPEKYIDKLSDYLIVEIAYQAVFSFEYSSEEFYSLTDEDMEKVKSRLKKYPFEARDEESDEFPKNIFFYYNDSKNLAVITYCGDIQMLYGASEEESFQRIYDVLKDIGEPI